MASIAAALRSPAAAGECPNPISSVQEQQLVKFGEVTGTDEDVAHALLEAHDWDLASAIMHYISQPIPAPRPPQQAHAPQPQPRPPSLLPLPSPPAAPLAAQRARSGSSFGSLDVDSLFMAAPTSPAEVGVLRSPCDSVEAVANYHPHTLVGFTPEDEKLASVAGGVPNPPPAWGPAAASPVRPFTSVVAASPVARAPPQGKASSTRSPAAAPAITPPPVPQQPRAPPPVKAPSLVPVAPPAAAAPKPLENGEQLYTKVTLRQAAEMFPLLEDDVISDVIETHAGNMAEVVNELLWRGQLEECEYPGEGPAVVYLNVYNLAPDRGFDKIGMGVYHSGLEVYGKEWGFGGGTVDTEQTGVFWTHPKEAMDSFFKRIELGRVSLSHLDLYRTVLKPAKDSWKMRDYHLMQKNCNHFCSHLAKELGLKKIPAWVNRAARWGDAIVPSPVIRYLLKEAAPPQADEVLEPQSARASSSSTGNGLFEFAPESPSAASKKKKQKEKSSKFAPS